MVFTEKTAMVTGGGKISVKRLRSLLPNKTSMFLYVTTTAKTRNKLPVKYNSKM